MSGFLDSLFGGKSSELNSLISTFGNVGQTNVNQGQSNENAGSKLWKDIVSGDATKTMQAIGPEASAEKTSAANSNKTTAMFGNRGGGTGASTAATTDKVHSDLTNLIGSLTNSSASNLVNLGENQVTTGLGSLSQEQGAVQQRIQNWSNSILGKSITGAVSAAESAGIGAGVGALPGGVGAAKGAAGALGITPPSGSGDYGVPQVPQSMFSSLFPS